MRRGNERANRSKRERIVKLVIFWKIRIVYKVGYENSNENDGRIG